MAAVFDRAIITKIQQASDIVEVVAEHISLVKKGSEMVGVCPFHDDHRPSLNVSGVKQIFKCFACGAGGDVFKFIQMRENLTFSQAIERLANRAGIMIKPTRQGLRSKDSAYTNPNELAKVNAWAAEFFRRNLCHKDRGRYARSYLTQRKIGFDAAERWVLGLSGGDGRELVKAASQKNISPKLLTAAGLAVAEDDGTNLRDKFINRLMFPITDVTGRTIGFGARTLADTVPKYMNSPKTALFDKSGCLYGLQNARHKIVSDKLAVVVEGYTDCIMAHSKGFTNAVASMGTSFTQRQASILRRYTANVVLVFDGDTAGVEAADRAMEICLAKSIDIKIAFVGEGKDPCDFLISAGKDSFANLIESAVDVFRFKWDRLTASLDGEDSLSAKSGAVKRYLQTIAAAVRGGNVSAIDRGLLVNRLSGIIGTDSRHINKELSAMVASAQRARVYSQKNQPAAKMDFGEGLFAAAQREILEVILNEPEYFKLVKENITPESFDVPILGQIAAAVFETLESEPQGSVKKILAAVESVNVGNCIVHLQQQGAEKENYKTRLTDALGVMRKFSSEKKMQQIKTTDETKFLQQLGGNGGKNPRSVGMT